MQPDIAGITRIWPGFLLASTLLGRNITWQEPAQDPLVILESLRCFAALTVAGCHPLSPALALSLFPAMRMIPIAVTVPGSHDRGA
jgi:hypothetical protein